MINWWPLDGMRKGLERAYSKIMVTLGLMEGMKLSGTGLT